MGITDIVVEFIREIRCIAAGFKFTGFAVENGHNPVVTNR
jgi:hypothetical protein